jgi:hypothetical protein
MTQEDIFALKGSLDTLATTEKSAKEKMERLASILSHLKVKVQEGWEAMTNEDNLLSRIQHLEEKVGAECRNEVTEKLIATDQSIKNHMRSLDRSCTQWV